MRTPFQHTSLSKKVLLIGTQNTRATCATPDTYTKVLNSNITYSTACDIIPNGLSQLTPISRLHPVSNVNNAITITTRLIHLARSLLEAHSVSITTRHHVKPMLYQPHAVSLRSIPSLPPDLNPSKKHFSLFAKWGYCRANDIVAHHHAAGAAVHDHCESKLSLIRFLARRFGTAIAAVAHGHCQRGARENLLWLTPSLLRLRGALAIAPDTCNRSRVL
jgi:hypothetical protein